MQDSYPRERRNLKEVKRNVIRMPFVNFGSSRFFKIANWDDIVSQKWGR